MMKNHPHPGELLRALWLTLMGCRSPMTSDAATQSVDRTRLLDRVIVSLDADKARDKAWDAVAAARDAGIERGESVPVAGRDAITRLRSELT